MIPALTNDLPLPQVEHTDAVTDREVSSSDDTHKS